MTFPEHIVVRPTGDRTGSADLALVFIVPLVLVRLGLSALVFRVFRLLVQSGHRGASHKHIDPGKEFYLSPNIYRQIWLSETGQAAAPAQRQTPSQS